MSFLGIEGAVAAVTGGSSGIGLATARLLLEEGARVALCARDPRRLQDAADELTARFGGERVLARPCDVLKPDEVGAFRDAVERRFGGLDMLINNAGQGRVSTFADTEDAAWTAELHLKFFGVLHPTRAFIALLERAKSPSIICVNALLALQPEPHMVATSAARAGLLNLARSLATEFAPKGIRVNSILVGVVESEQWRRRYRAEARPGESWEEWSATLASRKGVPLGRLGRPDEAARAIVYLASPAASYTTGSHLDISGGVARHV